VATGRKVGEACGRNLIPVTLELGGKDAMIVCRDADIERAADGAVRGSFFNTGHYCCGTERVYVPESIYQPFVEKVVEQASSLKQDEAGDGDVGAVFWDKQMDIIEGHMADAKQKGAKVLVGGERNRGLSGYFFPPTVLADVPPDAQILHREPFVPVAPILEFEDFDEVLERANALPFGLAAYVFTHRLDTAERAADALQSGMVGINDFGLAAAEAPFGGVKESGMGREGGAFGIREFLEVKTVKTVI